MIFETEYSERKNASIWWYDKSSDLHASAGSIWYNMQDDKRNKIAIELGLNSGFDMRACDPVYCMLWGLSFELLFKAIHVQINKEFGKIHFLEKLTETIPVKIDLRELNILKSLSQYIIWYGKYPVPMKESVFNEFDNILQNAISDEVINENENETWIKYNGAFDWDNLNELWRKYTTYFFDKYNERKGNENIITK